MARLALLTFVAAAAAYSQVGYPGQYPGPGTGTGPYPPGVGSPGIPMPGRGHKKKPKDAATDESLKHDKGKITSVSPTELVIETDDHREINAALTKDTKYLDANKPVKREDLAAGQTVWVACSIGDEEEYTAASVQIVEKPAGTVAATPPKSAPEKAASAEAETTDKPATIVENEPTNTPIEADDGQRPTVRRGKPRATQPVQVASARTPASAAAPVPDAVPPAEEDEEQPPAVDAAKAKADEEFIAKAREVASEFTQGLPNFSCKEVVTRYGTDSAKGRDTEWKPLDVISTGVVYEDGKESYRDLNKGGKKAPEKTGAWSYGEFGSVLAGLFNTGGRFTFSHDSDIHGFAVKMFRLEVDRPNSNWTIHEGAQTFRPAYKGRVWIDKSTYRVVRLETEAVEIPKEFPIDHAEMALDYQFVSLGSRKFMVPVHSEVLSCHRGTSDCEKNSIDFRNFRKFGSESDIMFGQ